MSGLDAGYVALVNPGDHFDLFGVFGKCVQDFTNVDRFADDDVPAHDNAVDRRANGGMVDVQLRLRHGNLAGGEHGAGVVQLRLRDGELRFAGLIRGCCRRLPCLGRGQVGGGPASHRFRPLRFGSRGILRGDQLALEREIAFGILH